MGDFIPNSKGIKTKRREVGLDEILDFIASFPDDMRLVTFGYFHMADLYKLKSKVNLDNIESSLSAEKERNGDKEWHKNLTASMASPAKKFKINVIQITRYTLNWMTPADYNKAYSAYAERLKAIRRKYGVPEDLDDNETNRKTDSEIVGSGLFGGEVNGDRDHRNKLYTKQNCAKILNQVRSYFYVDENGNISEDEIPESVIVNFLKQEGVDGASRVIDNMKRQSYEDEVGLLEGDYKFRKFILQKIMFINATPKNGDRAFWINDSMMDILDGLQIDTSRLVEIAKGYITESSKKHNMIMNEVYKFTHDARPINESKINPYAFANFDYVYQESLKSLYEGKVKDFFNDVNEYLESNKTDDASFQDEDGNVIATEPGGEEAEDPRAEKLQKILNLFQTSPLTALTVLGVDAFKRARNAAKRLKGKKREQSQEQQPTVEGA